VFFSGLIVLSFLPITVLRHSLIFSRAYAQDSSSTSVVTISDFAYSPQQLTVTQGQTVRFVNRDDVAHTVTDTNGAFDSGSLDQDKSWTYTFNKLGTYSYYCTVHPSMKGSITVNSQ
jgi:plastocyanin